MFVKEQQHLLLTLLYLAILSEMVAILSLMRTPLLCYSDPFFSVEYKQAIVIHCTPADQIVEQQERCSKYSQQAIGFAISTYSGFLVSPKPYSTGDTVVKIATSAAFFVAIIADLVSWRMKPRWGRALVYISTFHLMLMTFGIFISFDKDYGYLILLVLLIIMIAATLQRKIWHGVWQQSRDDNTTISQDLDLMWPLSKTWIASSP